MLGPEMEHIPYDIREREMAALQFHVVLTFCFSHEDVVELWELPVKLGDAR
jgi:hypothetical protein